MSSSIVGNLVGLAGVPPWLFRSTWRVALFNMVLVGAITATKSATNALFLARANPRALPFLYVVVAFVILGVTAALARVLSDWSPAKTLARAAAVSLALYVVFVALVILDVPFSTAGLYVIGEVSATSLSILFWARISDAFSPRNLRLVVGAISAGGMAGAVVGGVLIRLVVGVTGAALPIVVVNGLIVLALPALFGLRSVSRRQTLDRPPSTMNAVRYMSGNPYPLAVAFLVVLFAATGAGVDFVFRLESALLKSESDMAGLFGLLNAAVGVLVVIFQLSLTGPLLQRVGLFMFASIVPSMLAVLAVAHVVNPSFEILLVLKGVEMAGAFSLYNAAITLLYNPMPGEVRSQVRTLVDGAVKKGGAAVAGVVLGGFAITNSDRIGTGVVIGLTLVTLGLIPMLRLLYLSSLEQKLGARRRRGEPLTIDTRDKATADALLRALDGIDPDKVIASLEALGSSFALGARDLGRLLAHHDERVRLEALRHIPAVVDDALTVFLMKAIHDERARRPRSEAIRAVAKTAGPRAVSLVKRFLIDDDPGAVAAAIEVSLQFDADGEARQHLDRLAREISDANAPTRREVARLFGRLGDRRYDAALVSLLHDADLSVRKLAIDAAGREKSDAHLAVLVESLGERSLRVIAQDALVAYGDHAVEALSMALDDKTRPVAARIHIPRVLGAIDTELAARALLFSNPRDDAYLQRRIADRLAGIVARHPDYKLKTDRVDDAVRRRLTSYAAYRQAIRELATLTDASVRPLVRFVVERKDQNLRIALQLLGLRHGVERMMGVYRGLSGAKTDADAGRQAALELLDVGLGGDPMRDELLELLDRWDEPTISDTGRDRVLLLCRSKDPLLRALARRCARQILGPAGGDPEADGSSWRAITPGAEELEGEDMKEDIVERILFLENVDLFEGLHADDLAAIAGICVEEDFAPRSRVYAEGDPGDFLYVIVEGEIEIMKSDQLFLTLSPGESLGQVSFLDQGARPVSAHVSPRSKARMLRIERSAFMDLLSDRPGLMHSFFAVLASRLRVLIDREAQPKKM